MKKETFQIILFITCCILFCLAGCTAAKPRPTGRYVVTWRQGDEVKFKGLRHKYPMPAKFNIKVGDTLYMLNIPKTQPARF